MTHQTKRNGCILYGICSAIHMIYVYWVSCVIHYKNKAYQKFSKLLGVLVGHTYVLCFIFMLYVISFIHSLNIFKHTLVEPQPEQKSLDLIPLCCLPRLISASPGKQIYQVGLRTHHGCSSQTRAIWEATQIAKFMGPTWGPPGSCWPQMGPMLAPLTLLSG